MAVLTRYAYKIMKRFTQKFLNIFFAASCLVLSIQPCSDVAAKTADEYFVQAAFVMNFAKFTQWPGKTFADASDEIRLCVLGDDTVYMAFSEIEGKNINGHHLAVKKIKTIQEIENCHILFVSRSNRDYLPKIFAAVKEKSILTIGDMPGFTTSGGIISLEKEDDKIRFTINVTAAKQSRLKISSRLLRLAAIVE